MTSPSASASDLLDSPPPLTPLIFSPTLNDDIAREEAARHLADFVEATCHFSLEYWQKIITSRLELLTYQKGQRLLLHAFPQSGKSVIVSQRFPAWLLGRTPNHRIRRACYN